jgi:hypothetical protein
MHRAFGHPIERIHLPFAPTRALLRYLHICHNFFSLLDAAMAALYKIPCFFFNSTFSFTSSATTAFSRWISSSYFSIALAWREFFLPRF